MIPRYTLPEMAAVWSEETKLAHWLRIEVLAVDPAARGRGVARALMRAAESWAREHGFTRVSLNVWAQNERARGLYEHLGWEPTGREQPAEWPPYPTEVEYRLRESGT